MIMARPGRSSASKLGGRIWLLAAVAVLASPTAAVAATLEQARASAIVSLERSQNDDGSWGDGSTQALVTAEALLALAKAGRAGGPAAEQAIAWLRSHEYAAIDYRARAIRAVAAAGVNAASAAGDLVAIGAASTGWGTIMGGATNSYDSALVLGAIEATGVVSGDLAAKKAEVLARRRSDGGWSGDGVPGDPWASDLTVTAEIVRALSGVATSGELAPSLALLQTATGLAEADTLELAVRLSAIHAANATALALEAELLARATATGTWSSDPYVVALGLLAVATKPGATFGGGPTADDDGDGVQNQLDVFPQDPEEWADFDRDGIGDNHDADRDGDGVANAAEPPAFRDDPNEFADTDGDTLGDSADLDDDNDGVTDLEEAARGTDPRRADSDGDGVSDNADPCPVVDSGTDADGDGVCTPLDACPNDPTEVADLDHDLLCDNADTDDDGDGMSDAEELAAGTDPRSAASRYVFVAEDTWKDFDGDGLANLDEAFHHT
ncbi:MAG: thrombospondin type 3 repeat-containing protein, partial [Deltaproteobacteria bacterium]|nr:thrombospondin type 3 repeat-containing protein [Deltaproteobacteria bacterium]